MEKPERPDPTAYSKGPPFVTFLVAALFLFFSPAILKGDSSEYSFHWEHSPFSWDLGKRLQKDLLFQPGAEPILTSGATGTIHYTSFQVRNFYEGKNDSSILLDLILFPGNHRSLIERNGDHQMNLSGFSPGGGFSGRIEDPLERNWMIRLLFEKKLYDGIFTIRPGLGAGYRDRRAGYTGGSFVNAFHLDYSTFSDSSGYRFHAKLLELRLESQLRILPSLFSQTEFSWFPLGRGSLSESAFSYAKRDESQIFQMDRWNARSEMSGYEIAQTAKYSPGRKLILTVGVSYVRKSIRYREPHYTGGILEIPEKSASPILKLENVLEILSDREILDERVKEEEYRFTFSITRRSGFIVDETRLEGYAARFKLPNGSVYTGIMEDNQFHGNGRLVYPDGTEYRGEWIRGKRDGYGVLQSSDGSRYDGQWRNDTREGAGTLRLPDGSVYEGTFRNNSFEGYGVLELPGGERLEGIWKDGILLDEGEIQNFEGLERKEE